MPEKLFYDAFLEDAKEFRRDNRLVPLWKSEDAKRYALEHWENMKSALLSEHTEHWSFWVTWYEACLNGIEVWPSAFAQSLGEYHSRGLSEPPGVAIEILSLELERVTNGTASRKEPPKPAEGQKRVRRKRGNAEEQSKTIGKSLDAHGVVVVVQARGLIAMLDAEIERLSAERPNYPEAIKAKELALGRLQEIRATLVALTDIVTRYVEKQATAASAATALDEFWQPFSKFWKEDGPTMLRGTAQSAIFCGGVALACLAGAPAAMATVVMASISLGEPISKIAKALRAYKPPAK